DGVIRNVSQLLSPEHFEQQRTARGYAALPPRFNLFLDSLIIFLSLYLSAKYLGIRWQEGYLTIAFGSIFLFEIVASYRNFYGSRRTRPAWREAGEDLLLWTLSFTGAAMILTAATGWPASGADRHL